MTQSCQNCKFWNLKSEGQNDLVHSDPKTVGHCVKHAPQASVVASKSDYSEDQAIFGVVAWPVTYENMWCGDWQIII